MSIHKEPRELLVNEWFLFSLRIDAARFALLKQTILLRIIVTWQNLNLTFRFTCLQTEKFPSLYLLSVLFLANDYLLLMLVMDEWPKRTNLIVSPNSQTYITEVLSAFENFNRQNCDFHYIQKTKLFTVTCSISVWLCVLHTQIIFCSQFQFPNINQINTHVCMTGA